MKRIVIFILLLNSLSVFAEKYYSMKVSVRHEYRYYGNDWWSTWGSKTFKNLYPNFSKYSDPDQISIKTKNGYVADSDMKKSGSSVYFLYKGESLPNSITVKSRWFDSGWQTRFSGVSDRIVVKNSATKYSYKSSVYHKHSSGGGGTDKYWDEYMYITVEAKEIKTMTFSDNFDGVNGNVVCLENINEVFSFNYSGLIVGGYAKLYVNNVSYGNLLAEASYTSYYEDCDKWRCVLDPNCGNQLRSGERSEAPVDCIKAAEKYTTQYKLGLRPIEDEIMIECPQGMIAESYTDRCKRYRGTPSGTIHFTINDIKEKVGEDNLFDDEIEFITVVYNHNVETKVDKIYRTFYPPSDISVTPLDIDCYNVQPGFKVTKKDYQKSFEFAINYNIKVKFENENDVFSALNLTGDTPVMSASSNNFIFSVSDEIDVSTIKEYENNKPYLEFYPTKQASCKAEVPIIIETPPAEPIIEITPTDTYNWGGRTYNVKSLNDKGRVTITKLRTQSTVDGDHSIKYVFYKVGSSTSIGSYKAGDKISGLVNGDQIYFKDAAGCISRKFNVTLKKPDALKIISLVENKKVSCHSGQNPTNRLDLLSNGRLKLKVSGGIGKYFYSLDNRNWVEFNNFETEISGLTAKSHTVYVRNRFANESKSKSCTVGTVARLSITSGPTVTAPDCELVGNAKLSNIKFTGGTSSYSAVLYKGNRVVKNIGSVRTGFGVSPRNQTGYTKFSPYINSGNYKIKITDANSCFVEKTFSIAKKTDSLKITNISTVKQLGCIDGTKGSVKVNINKTTGSFSYQKNSEGFVPGSTFNNLNKDEKRYIVRDNVTGCMASMQGNPSFKSALFHISSIDTTTNRLACATAENGKISVSATGGNFSSYSFEVDGDNNTYKSKNGSSVIFDRLPNERYTIKATDGDGCESQIDNVTIKLLTTPVKVVAEDNQIKACKADVTAKVKLTGINGVGPYDFSLTTDFGEDNKSNKIISKLGAKDEYTFYVRDAEKCISSVKHKIEVSKTPVKIIDIVKDKVACKNAGNASLSFKGKNGIPNYDYYLNGVKDSDNNGKFSGLNRGTHKIKVVDSHNCVSEQNVTIEMLPTNDTINIIAGDISFPDKLFCNVAENGSVRYRADGGVGKYKYKLFEQGASSKLVDNKSGGYNQSEYQKSVSLGSKGYKLTAVDSAGCLASYDFKVPLRSDSIHFDGVVFDSLFCNLDVSGEVTVNVSRGAGDYKYSVNGGTEKSDNNFTNLNYRTPYTFIAKDKYGCSVSTQINQMPVKKDTITLRPLVLDSLYCTTDIETGKITTEAFNGGGNYTYYLNGVEKSSFEKLLYNKKYVIAAKDQYGCFTYDSVKAFPLSRTLDSISFDITSTDALACDNAKNGTITIESKNGVRFSDGTYKIQRNSDAVINKVNHKFEKLTKETHNITVTDAVGCKMKKSMDLPLLSQINNTLDFTPVACKVAKNGEVRITAENGLPFSDGSYKYYLIDPATDKVTDSSKAVIGDFRNLGLDFISYNIVDSAGCSFANNKTINNPFDNSAPRIPVISDTIRLGAPMYDKLACSYAKNGAIEILAGGGVINNSGFSYVIDNSKDTIRSGSGNAVKFDNLDNSEHIVKVIDSANCSTIKRITIPEITNQISIDNITDNKKLACTISEDGIVEVTARDGAAYRGGNYNYWIKGWSRDTVYENRTGVFDTLSIQKYTLFAQDSAGCTTSSDHIVELRSDSVNLNFPAFDSLACNVANDGAIRISAKDGASFGGLNYNFELVGASQVRDGVELAEYSGLNSSTHIIKVTDKQGCTDTMHIDIPERTDQIRINKVSFDSLACNYASNGAIEFSATDGVPYSGGNYDYSFFNKINKREKLSSTKYFGLDKSVHIIEAHDSQGCSDTLHVKIPEIKKQIEIGNINYPQHLACAVANDGIVASTAINGAAFKGGKYNYWIEEMRDSLHEEITSKFDTLANRNYTLFVQDSAGCFTSDVIRVPLRSDSVQLNFPQFDSLACSYASNAAIFITAKQGAPYESDRYSFKLSGYPEFDTTRASLAKFSGLDVAPKVIEVTDEQGCKDSETFVIPQIKQQVAFEEIVHTKLGCKGAADGKIYLKAKDGSAITGGRYSYILDGDTVKSVVDHEYLRLNKNLHKVTAIDSAGCIVNSNEYIMPRTDSVQIDNLLFDSLACDVANDGGIKILSSLGAGNHTFYVDGVKQDINHFTRLNSNIHKVVVRDTAMCADSMEVDIPRIINPIRIKSILFDSLYCKVAENGIINVTAEDGVGEYRYSVNDNVNYTNNPFTGLKYNTEYRVRAIDKEGCTIDSVVYMPVRTDTLNTLLPVVKTYGDDGRSVSCIGRTDGAIDITVINSVGALSYDWSSNNGSSYTSEDVMALDTGKYSVTVTDNISNCKTSIYNIALHQPDSIDIIKSGQTAPTCFQKSDGNLMVSATNIFSDTDFTLKETSQSFNVLNRKATFTGLEDGFYNIHIKDALGCEAQEVLEVKNKEIVKPYFTEFAPDCPGSNGSLLLDSVRGHYNNINEYEFIWSNGINRINKPDLKNVKPGEYLLTILDKEHKCRHILDKAYTLETKLGVSNKIDKSDASCETVSNGYIFIDETRNPLQKETKYYLWNEHFSDSVYANQYISGLAVGEYNLKVKYLEDGCEKTDKIIIGHHDIEMNVSDIENSTCSSVEDGSAIINASGIPGADFTYSVDKRSWSDDKSLTSLSASEHKVLVKDKLSGCADSLTFDVGLLPELSVSTALVDSASSGINNGVVSAIYGGGSGRYVTKWTDENDIAVDTSALLSGRYSVKLSDKRNLNCSTESSVNIPSRTKISINEIRLIHKPLCDSYKGAAEIIDEFGATPVSYYWISGSDTVSRAKLADNLTEGTYKIVAIDKYGVKDETIWSISKGELLNVTFTEKPTACEFKSGEAELNVTGGIKPYKYNWSDNYVSDSNIRKGIGFGKYIVEISDAVNCSVNSDTIRINRTENPDFNVTLSESYCQLPNGTGTVNASGGTGSYTYIWKDSDGKVLSEDAHFDKLKQGEKYSVKVKDENGCMKSKENYSVNDMLNAEPIVKLTVTDSAACDKPVGKIKSSVTGGFAPYTYSWNIDGESDKTLNNVIPGEYKLSVTDSKGCVKYGKVDIYNRILPSVKLVDTQNSYCGKELGRAKLLAKGTTPAYVAYVFGMKDASSTFNLKHGEYESEISKLLSGDYKAYISDKFGCNSDTINFSIGEDPKIEASLLDSRNITCNGDENGNALFSVKNGQTPFRYLIDKKDSDSRSFNNLTPGKHTFMVIDNAECFDTSSVIINQPQPLDYENLQKRNPVCFGSKTGIVAFDAVGGNSGYSYIWNGARLSDVEDTLKQGVYNIQITDSKGCKKDFSVELTNPEKIASAGIEDRVVICKGQEVSVKPDAMFTRAKWTSNVGISSNSVNEVFTEEGEYYLQAWTKDECEVLDTLKIGIDKSLLETTFLMPSEAAVGDTVSLIEVTYPIPDSSRWTIPAYVKKEDGGLGITDLFFKYSGTYEIELTSFLNECVDNEVKFIEIKDADKVISISNEDEGNSLFQLTNLYPNPNSGKFKIEIKLSHKFPLEIEIYNVASARYVDKQKFEASKEFVKDFDISSFKGVNMAKLTANGQSVVLVFVVN